MPVHSKPVIGSGPEPFQISWPTEFWDDRNPLEAKPHVQHRLELALTPTSLPTGEVPSPPDPTSDAHPPEQNSKDEPNHLQLFLRAYDDDEPTIQEEEITDFCEGVHPSVLKQADRGQRTSAWLDDRLYSIYCELGPIKYPIPNSEASTKRVQAAPMGLSSPSPGRGWDDSTSEDATSCSSTKTASATLLYRKYNPPLSASALYEHLMAKQFGHPELPDADRRLISISNLSPPFIFALTETAFLHQAPALIDTIFKHLALQTYMGVNISHGYYTVFELQFHMPFYALRKSRSLPCKKDEVFVKPPRKWRDVSFVIDSSGIHESHMAFTVCGVADRRWVAYAFRDTDYDEDQDMGEFEFDYNGMAADQIAADGARPVNANHPVWNPREYYLMIVSRKLSQIVGEWAKLIRKLEKGIQKHVDGPPSVKTPSEGSLLNDDVKATFDRTQKTLLFLGDLHDALLRINEAWTQFSSTGGDIGYFHDFENVPQVSQIQCQRLLHEIKGRFDEFKDLQRRLGTLVRSCERTANILQLRITLESNNTAKLSGSIAELMVAWVSPVGIVSAFFAIPEPFVGKHRNGKSFAGAILILMGVMQLLIFFSKGQLQPRYIFRKVKDMKGQLQSRNLQLQETFENLRRGRLSRADIDATLVAADTAAADA